MYSSKPQPKPKSKSKPVPKGSHRMPDGSIMKNNDPSMKKKKKSSKPAKIEDNCADTSRCPSGSVKYSDNLKVEETLEKKKEVKESDIFEGTPPKSKSKKIASKLKK